VVRIWEHEEPESAAQRVSATRGDRRVPVRREAGSARRRRQQRPPAATRVVAYPSGMTGLSSSRCPPAGLRPSLTRCRSSRRPRFSRPPAWPTTASG
jgi:hypothetical protein